MKIKIDKDSFLKALQKVGNTISTRNTLPILSNILLKAKDQKLTIIGTDLEIRVTTMVEANVEEEGEITVPAKKILTLVSKFRAKEISLESVENFHSRIKCGNTSALLVGLDPSGFPVYNQSEFLRSFKLNQMDVFTFLERISYAVSIQDSRVQLQGILLSLKNGKFVAVATDGKRLAMCEKMLSTDDGEVDNSQDGDVIITLKSANELKRLLDKEGDLTVSVSENQILFDLGDTQISSKIIDEAYPNYRQVIPSSFKQSIIVPRDDVSYAIDLLSNTFMEASSPSISLTFSENSLLFELNSIIGEGKERVDIEYTGEPFSMSFSTNLLLDPFRHLDCDMVQIKINDTTSPVVFESMDGFLYVLMPMRNK